MGRRKIDYMHHVLNAVCMYMSLNGASKKEIIDDVKKKLKRRVGEDVNAEVCKALSAALRSQIIEKQNGRYRLKISTIQDKFQDTDIIPIDDNRRPHCTMCGTKILLDKGQQVRSRRRVGARTIIGRALTAKGDEVRRAKSRKNATFAVTVDDSTGKKTPSKAVGNAGPSSRRIKKANSLTKRVRRHVYTEQHDMRQQQEQASKKLTVVHPVSKMNYDMSDSNAIDEYNQKTFSLDDASGFKHRTNESHSDQYSYLQKGRSIYD